jgi:hypothetical protein
MASKAKLYNLIGYSSCIIISILLGWVSALGCEKNDYVQKLSNNIIPLLLTLLVLYSTLTIHLINELRKLGNNRDLSSVVYALKSNIVSEIIIVIILFVVLVLKSCLQSHFESSANLIKIATNSIVVFAFLYFIWVIIDVTMGLYDLVIENLKNNS